MRIVIALVVVVALVACGGGGTRKVGSGGGGGRGERTPEKAASNARGIVEQWRQAWQVRSVQALGKLYPHDLDVVVVEQGRAQLGWTPVETWLSTKMSGAKTVIIELDDLQVFMLGDGAAAASATMRREISDGVTSTKETGVITWALREESDGTWRIVSEHYSYSR